MKRIFAILLAVGLCITAIALVVSHRRHAEHAAQQAAWQKMKAERAAELEWVPKPAPPQEITSVAPIAPTAPEQPPLSKVENVSPATSSPPSESARVNPPMIAKAPTTANAINPPSQPRPGKNWQDPLAREALSYVGADLEAEEVWADAINNPDLPPNERKDLIEDLNEDGFPDPKNITEEDLPLILSRLRLIEAHGPNAMDDVNAEAFREAYKDLVKMYLRLVGQ